MIKGSNFKGSEKNVRAYSVFSNIFYKHAGFYSSTLGRFDIEQVI